VQPRAPV